MYICWMKVPDHPHEFDPDHICFLSYASELCVLLLVSNAEGNNIPALIGSRTPLFPDSSNIHSTVYIISSLAS